MKQCKCTTLRSRKLKATCTISLQSSLHVANEAVGTVRIQIPSALDLRFAKTTVSMLLLILLLLLMLSFS